MTAITLKGNPIHTSGELPKAGGTAPAFTLVGQDLKDVGLKDFSGKRKVLNVFPSIDTPVCATSVRKFNEKAAQARDTVILSISEDLPFAMKRFCAAEGIDQVINLSLMRGGRFAEDYGLRIVDGPLAGLCARAVIVLDRDDKVLHAELVKDIAHEPDYDAALKALA